MNLDQAFDLTIDGECPICAAPVTFRAQNSWLRDHLFCSGCISIPRERATMLVIEECRPDWRALAIHEGSPDTRRGASAKLAAECPLYVGSQFYPACPLGSMKNGFRIEDLERQTFPSESFDLVVTQDVMEHVFQPDTVYREIWRTLRPGGLYIHTTPIYAGLIKSERWAERKAGLVFHIKGPEYHGNPIDEAGSLVTFHFGYDLPQLITTWTPFDVELRRYQDRRHGILGEFTDVLICRKSD